MIRYGFGVTYPNGKKEWCEYRSKEENFEHAKRLKEWSDKNNKGLTVKVIKYERLHGSDRVIEAYQI